MLHRCIASSQEAHCIDRSCGWYLTFTLDQKPSFKIKEKAKDQAMPPVPTAELPYVCDYPDCTKAFAKSESLKKHATLTHQIKLFKCTVDGCDRRLGSQNKLRSHLNIVHWLGKPSQERASRKEAESQRRDDSLTPEPPSETWWVLSIVNALW